MTKERIAPEHIMAQLEINRVATRLALVDARPLTTQEAMDLALKLETASGSIGKKFADLLLILDR